MCIRDRSLVIANTAIAISAVGYGSEFLGATLSPLSIALWTIFTLWLATVLNFGGARITGNISSFTIWGVIIPVVGISIIGWKWFDGSMYVNSWNPHNVPTFEAVSYTHLDVYKRQGLFGTDFYYVGIDDWEFRLFNRIG